MDALEEIEDIQAIEAAKKDSGPFKTAAQVFAELGYL
jgi:hypothetical protein